MRQSAMNAPACARTWGLFMRPCSYRAWVGDNYSTPFSCVRTVQQEHDSLELSLVNIIITCILYYYYYSQLALVTQLTLRQTLIRFSLYMQLLTRVYDHSVGIKLHLQLQILWELL